MKKEGKLTDLLQKASLTLPLKPGAVISEIEDYRPVCFRMN